MPKLLYYWKCFPLGNSAKRDTFFLKSHTTDVNIGCGVFKYVSNVLSYPFTLVP